MLISVLALAAVAGQAVIYLGGGLQPSLDVGMPTVLAAGLFAGIVYGIADHPFAGIGEAPAPIVAPATRKSGLPRAGNIFVFTAVVLGFGELLGIAALASGSWPSPVALAAPLLYGGFFTFVAVLVGSLLAGLIVWPIAELLITGEGTLRGRRINQRLVAVSLALLSVVAFGVFLALSTHVTAADAAPRQRGIVMIARLFVDYTGDAGNQVEAWIARVLLVALAAAIVWAIRAPAVARVERVTPRGDRRE